MLTIRCDKGKIILNLSEEQKDFFLMYAITDLLQKGAIALGDLSIESMQEYIEGEYRDMLADLPAEEMGQA